MPMRLSKISTRLFRHLSENTRVNKALPFRHLYSLLYSQPLNF